jgi:hypothetical protein
MRDRLGEEADKIKAEQLAALDEAEREAWDNLAKSAGMKKRTVRKDAQDPDKSYEQIVKWREYADPRYLQILVSIVKERSELLGLKAPTQVEIDKYIIEVVPATLEDAEKLTRKDKD